MDRSNEFNKIIKKIKRNRKIVIALSIVAVIIVFNLCGPTHLSILDKTIIDYKGVSPIIAVLLFALVLFVEAIAYALVSSPLTTSLEVECDPEKHLFLNSSLENQNKDQIYAVDFIYMGNFEVALNYANKMVESKKTSMILSGLFNKARCEFFMGEYESLKLTVQQYENVFNNMKKPNQKVKETFEKILKIMNLMVAISCENKEEISDVSNITVWNNLKVTQGFVDYLKGVSAYLIDNEKEAVYRFMSVKENCEKTVFAKLAEEYLLKLE
ncbi:MAG: hypothetical protein IJD90_02080 [Clostridia bacterium]|nr:hypothetical protein [Clostridia bacterium]